MKTRNTAAASLVGLIALGGVAPLDELGFHPAESLLVAKTFSERTSWMLDSMDQTVDGEPLVDEFPEVEGSSTRDLALTDEFITVGDGRFLELLRTYESIASSAEVALVVSGMEDERSIAFGSELEETGVRFRWNAESGEYDRAFDEGESGEAELLEGLDADLELTGLLPPGEVEEGDTWDVPAEALRALLVPGGDLGTIPTDFESSNSMLLEDRMLLVAGLSNVGGGADTIEGTVKAEYRGSEEVAGRRIARIELAMDVTVTVDHTARLARSAEEIEVEGPGTLEATTEIDGEVLVTWDLAGGHVASAVSDAEVAITLLLAYEQAMGEISLELVGTFELSGTTHLELVVER